MVRFANRKGKSSGISDVSEEIRSPTSSFSICYLFNLFIILLSSSLYYYHPKSPQAAKIFAQITVSTSLVVLLLSGNPLTVNSLPSVIVLVIPFFVLLSVIFLFSRQKSLTHIHYLTGLTTENAKISKKSSSGPCGSLHAFQRIPFA